MQVGVDVTCMHTKFDGHGHKVIILCYSTINIIMLQNKKLTWLSFHPLVK